MNMNRANFGLNINISNDNKDLVDESVGFATDNVAVARGVNFTDGNGANEADCCYHTVVALDTSSTLNLSDSSLSDVFGTSINLSKLKAIFIKNNTDSDLQVGGAAANAVDLFADSTDILVIQPGGELVFIAPDANGVDVSTNDALKLAHQGSGSQEVELILVGVQT